MGTRRLGRAVTEAARSDVTSGAGTHGNASAGPWIDPAARRVGILGGTFDPIHFGHLIIADQVREALELDRVLFIPAAMPPHKLEEQVTPAVERAAMVELAIAGNPGFSMCPIELERSGPSYTVDTLSELAGEAARQGVDREFHFILSVEALALFKSWHEPARLLELARLAVVARPGAPMPVGRRLGALLRLSQISGQRTAAAHPRQRAPHRQDLHRHLPRRSHRMQLGPFDKPMRPRRPRLSLSPLKCRLRLIRSRHWPGRLPRTTTRGA